MPNRLRVVFGGVLLDSQRWSIGFSMSMPTSPGLTAQDMNAYAIQAFTDFNTTAWSTTTAGAQGLRTLVPSASNLDSCKAYLYQTGQTVAILVGTSNQNAVAGTGNDNLPPQCSLVASLQTGYAGRANHGRVYIPYLGAGVSSNRAAVNVGGIATSIANYLSVARTRTAGGGTVVPVVTGSNTAVPAPITRVVVDNVIDTQRRRRDKVSATQRTGVNVIVG